jgi:diacylglycerol kinase family enzyme
MDLQKRFLGDLLRILAEQDQLSVDRLVIYSSDGTVHQQVKDAVSTSCASATSKLKLRTQRVYS